MNILPGYDPRGLTTWTLQFYGNTGHMHTYTRYSSLHRNNYTTTNLRHTYHLLHTHKHYYFWDVENLLNLLHMQWCVQSWGGIASHPGSFPLSVCRKEPGNEVEVEFLQDNNWKCNEAVHTCTGI